MFIFRLNKKKLPIWNFPNIVLEQELAGALNSRAYVDAKKRLPGGSLTIFMDKPGAYFMRIIFLVELYLPVFILK
jgi:hypothetical protein